MTMMVAVGMMQNDARISRGLTTSYTYSYQSTLVKIITAAAEMEMLYNMEVQLKYHLALLPEINCNPLGDEDSCYDNIKAAVGAKVLTEEFSENVFSNIITAIMQATGLDDVGIEDDDVWEALRGTEPIKLDFSSGGAHFVLKIDKSVFEDPVVQEKLTLRFQDPLNPSNSMAVALVPHDFRYKTQYKLLQYMRQTAHTYVNLRYGSCTFDNDEGLIRTETRWTSSPGDKYRLETKWDVDGAEAIITIDNGVLTGAMIANPRSC